MPQAENEKEKDDNLRRFIDRLENWPEDAPPSPAELRALRREIRLTQEDRDKLELLSENHIRRARSSMTAGAYDQAAAELARAAQLRPLDSRPKVELAEIYLQRSLERGYGRNDRSKAVRLAKKALELNPTDQEARNFLQEFRRMNADFRYAKYRRYIFPIAFMLTVLIFLAWWQREWVVNFILPSGNPPATSPSSPPAAEQGDDFSRIVDVNLSGLEGGALDTEILSASVGRRNDASYVEVKGRIRAAETESLGALSLIVKGQDASGNILFALPVSVRDGNSPLLRPGDSQALSLFRWLTETETSVHNLEIQTLNIELDENPPPFLSGEATLVWDAPRPEGAGLEAEVRDMQILEAYDRQVMLMDLAVTNTGTGDMQGLSLNLSLGSEWAGIPHRAVGLEDPALARGERRVWSLAMGFPLDADLSDRPVTVRVTEVSR